MINLTQSTINDEIFIYVNTLDPDLVPQETPSFLFGFKNSYDNTWSYVVPMVLEQNSRFVKFQIRVCEEDFEDPINAEVALGPTGNWTYKLWSTDEPTLDPSYGNLIDEGQMQLFGLEGETRFVSYVSSNDSTKAVVYLTRDGAKCLSWSTCPDLWNMVVVQWNNCN